MARDWNGLLAYTTVKCVKIRNWKLGAIHYFFQFAIFCYVVIYAVLYERGFMYKEQIIGGSLTLNSKAPSAGAESSYCCGADVGCPVANDTSRLPCAYWDEYQAEYPPSQSKEIAVTTRATVTRQTTLAECTYQSWDETCVWTEGASAAQFVDRAEGYTIRIRHGVRGQVVNKQGVNTGKNAMSGSLIDPNDPTTSILSWPNNNSPLPGQSSDDRTGDIIPLSDILAAVDVNLDAMYLDEDGGLSNMRYDGINIVISVLYEMEGIAGSTLKYTYIPRLLDNLEYKIEETQLLGAPNVRDVLNRHCVRLIFIQTGVIGTFDFTALLITLVTALGLLAVANTLTNLVMTKLLEQKDLYNWHTTEVTEDVDKVLQLPQEEFDARMKMVKMQMQQGKGSFFALDPDNNHLQKPTETEKTPLIGGDESVYHSQEASA
eukprot:m.415631 g.415631  ORF g.415631 m.415631 type:complete len:432 (-) comp29704_c0_seq1:174-1469(-)